MAESGAKRLFDVLRFVLESSDSVGVQQVARGIDQSVSTVHRALNAMVEERILFYDEPSRRYRVGGEFLRLSAQAMTDSSVSGRMRQILAALAAELDETVVFNLYEPSTGTMVVSIVERGPNPLGYELDIGRRDPIHAGASGRAILAFLPEPDIARYLRRRDLARLTGDTITKPAALRALIVETRDYGVAVSRGERIEGAIGIAAPVRSREDRVLGSVLITIPEFRGSASAIERGKALVRQAAKTLSAVSAGADADIIRRETSLPPPGVEPRRTAVRNRSVQAV